VIRYAAWDGSIKAEKTSLICLISFLTKQVGINRPVLTVKLTFLIKFV